ncbi:WD40 repeat domain-containing protein [Streptomyces paradoxus]|uniref:WD40 repeat domain-containing protein n=1 Tax=Streptomyces paradoxus TaxID=66375 RepID=UPI0038260B39
MPYVRRHLAEHAAAGGVLGDRLLSAQFLPYADAERLRAVLAQAQPVDDAVLGLWRQVAHACRWEDPAANADALRFRLAAAGRSADRVAHPGSVWWPHWVRWPVERCEIVARHPGGLWSLDTAVLPHGQVVAVTGGEDGTVRVWDLITGAPVGEPLTGHSARVRAVATAVLADGRVVVVTGSSDSAVRVWDLSTGELLHALRVGALDHGVRCVATATLGDGRVLALIGASLQQEPVRAWDLTTGARVCDASGRHPAGVTALAATRLPDGRTVLVTCCSADRAARVWDVEDGRQIGGPPDLTGETGALYALATTRPRHGQPVAVVGSDDGSVHLIDLMTGERTGRPMIGHDYTVGTADTAVLPDGRHVAVTAGNDGKLRMWDLPTGQGLSAEVTSRTSEVRTVRTTVLSGERTVAVAGNEDGTVRLWDLASLATGSDEQWDGEGDFGIRAVATAVLPTGRAVVLTGHRERVRVWNLTSGALIDDLPAGHVSGISAITTAALPDGRVVAFVCSGFNHSIWLWDLTENRSVGTLTTRHAIGVQFLATALLPDGRTAAVTSGDGSVGVWDPLTGDLMAGPVPGGPLATATLPDGRPVAVVGRFDGTLNLLDPATLDPVADPLRAHSAAVDALRIARLPDGRIVAVSAGEDDLVRVHDLTSGRPVGARVPAHGPDRSLTTVTLPGPDRSLLTVTGGGEGRVRLWDTATGAAVGHPLATDGHVRALLGTERQGVPVVLLGGAGLACLEITLA